MSVMLSASSFDELQSRTWRPLLLETFAVSGDLGSAREALRFAFTELWRQREHIGAQGPEAFLREHAYQRALWRHRTRFFPRKSKLPAEQSATLAALAELPATSRKALVMAALTDLPLETIAQVIAEPAAEAETHLTAALDQVTTTLAIDDTELITRIQALESTTRAAAQPVPSTLRSQGVRRGRLWLAVGSVAAVAATVAAGVVVAPPDDQDSRPTAAPVSSTVTAKRLVTEGDLAEMGTWTTDSTGDNTRGSGINSFCQAARFADPKGVKALVRTFTSSAKPNRELAQTIELSRGTQQARAGYATALQWFGGCKQTQVQLLSTYRVTGLGDEAAVLKFRGTGSRLSSYAVGIARAGDLTTWLAIRSNAARNPDTGEIVDAMTTAVRRLCSSPAAGDCPTRPAVTQNAPPPSGEAEGMLAVADLPRVGSITENWVGTKAGPAGTNAASTTCDRTDFADAGARRSLSRTFLIPEADIPDRFGLTETYGLFPSTASATKLVDRIRSRMASCEKRDLSATVSDARSKLAGTRGSTWSMWRLKSEIGDESTVSYWMGVTRVGPFVAQVGFVPGGKSDLTADQFQALMERARDRLFEFPRDPNSPSASATPSPSQSGSPSPEPTDGRD